MLSTVTQPGLTAIYTYKADNMRISKTVNGETTNHIWDGSNIVAETSSAGSIIDAYVRGGGLISSNQHGFYVFNGHGDVVQLTDATGTVTRDYDFDAFGVERDTDEEDTNPWRYCAEYTDLETGNIYLRHRYYDPATGRFLNEDPIRDGLNYYAYANNNPVKYIDPLGLFALGQSSFFSSTNSYMDRFESGAVLGMPAALPAAAPILAKAVAALKALGVVGGAAAGARGAAWVGNEIGGAISTTTSTKTTSGTTISSSGSSSRSSSFNSSQSVAIPIPVPNTAEREKTTSKSESATLAVPIVKTRTNDDNKTYIYRWGNNSGYQLSPRPKDTVGLSYTTILPVGREFTMTTMEAVNSTGVLRAVVDNPKTGHVSVFPVDLTQMQGWIDSGGMKANKSPHPYTLILQGISIYVPAEIQ